jgi:hypothetical protein
MTFPIPPPYTTDAADIKRDEAKRILSPPSFFFSQTHGLLLAAGYFKNSRLLPSARGGVAAKHRNRINGALFAQTMAAFEFCLKDFIAGIVDLTDVFDERINSASWINVDKARILAQRDVAASVGAILVHPLLGWHEPETVNDRFNSLFSTALIPDDAVQALQRLWIVRHSVAHNAGFVTPPRRL